MGDLSSVGLRLLLQRNVVELKTIRRHAKGGFADTRRFLATNCSTFLNSLAGRVTLKFTPPTQPPAYDAKVYNLVCAYDLMSLDYRMIPVESNVIVSAFPVFLKKDQDKFWEWFEKSGLSTWTFNEKKTFVDS